REGDDVVLRGLFDFVDARDVEAAALPDITSGVHRHETGGGHGFRRRGFHQQPRFVASLVAPDSPHFRVGIARDHQFKSRRSLGISSPFTSPSTVADSEPSRNRSPATRWTSVAETFSIPASVSSRPN